MSRKKSARATKRRLARAPARGRGTGESREKSTEEQPTAPVKAGKDATKRGRPQSATSPDSPSSSSLKPPQSTRTRKQQDNPVALLSEMKDLEKRLRATVGGTVCPDEEFKHMVDHLRTVCPPPKMCKVVVKRVEPEDMTNDHGSCSKERNVFTIEINRALNEYETEHVLIHEWAHMLAWRPYHPLMGDHGSDWGVWYAMAWRKYHGIE